MPKILIIRFSSIGDIVLTSPLVRCVKKQVPQAEVHFCVKAQFAFLVAPNPHVDKVHCLGPQGLGALLGQLRAEKYDYIIDLQRNRRSWLIKTALGANLPFGRLKAFSFAKLNWEKWLFTAFKINRLPNVHIVDRYLAAAAPLGVQMDRGGLDYFIPYADEVEPNWLPPSHQAGFVALVIGGSYETKKLPLPRLIELCDKINRPIVLLGGKEDQPQGEAIAQFFAPGPHPTDDEALGKRTVIYNGCGKFNFNQSASLVRQATVVFSHDTGLMHVAAAFRKTVYSIWGNTTPFFGMYPYRTKFFVLENNRLRCRPCSKLGHKRCPKGHFNCMNGIVFDFYLP
ncbi:MAG: glycosyltransferase family 9 protein [Bernardetiaceae bacterium]|jgi:ADP-heptose:LPS heptosyltransferase|nr:glycosyltransferase family 9 protein [Bernardetiaceae bacterium]